MINAYIITGTVIDDHTVTLDEALPTTVSKVRVIVEPMPSPVQKQSYLEVMAEIRESQKARGHVPMTREEVDEYLRQERDSWDDE